MDSAFGLLIDAKATQIYYNVFLIEPDEMKSHAKSLTVFEQSFGK